jgi:hypothetical protein
VLGSDRPFTFDFAFDENTTQSEIYQTCAVDLIDGLFNGYNATILAYGQTGGGKVRLTLLYFISDARKERTPQIRLTHCFTTILSST